MNIFPNCQIFKSEYLLREKVKIDLVASSMGSTRVRFFESPILDDQVWLRLALDF